MNGDYCYYCKRAMGNSLHKVKIAGATSPLYAYAHLKCEKKVKGVKQ